MRYFLLHKPRGCITSTVDDTGRGRPTVYDVAKVAGTSRLVFRTYIHTRAGTTVRVLVPLLYYCCLYIFVALADTSCLLSALSQPLLG